jgi:predicted enzyme related to lactoylglutathione lyase
VTRHDSHPTPPHLRRRRARRTDIAAAEEFYAEAFGWIFTDCGPAYSGIGRPGGEGEMGGLNPERPAGPGLPLVILCSDDLDATYAAVRSAGGTIDEEIFDFPVADACTSATRRATPWRCGSSPERDP